MRNVISLLTYAFDNVPQKTGDKKISNAAAGKIIS
jgi:hypothetical protein